MKKDLTNKIIIVLSTMFILSSCVGGIDEASKNVDANGESIVEESFDLKAKGSETQEVKGESSGSVDSSVAPIIN